MKSPGIVICSRVDSTRIPHKPLQKIHGQTILEHLITRLQKTGVPIFVAVPAEQVPSYKFLLDVYPDVNLFGGECDPLQRMDSVAKTFDLDAVVRVCHDKVFVDPAMLLDALHFFGQTKIDYLFSSSFTEGSGFEIISSAALDRAVKEFGQAEHISYAIKACTSNIVNYSFCKFPQLKSSYRLLIDYPRDITLISEIIAMNGRDCSLQDAIFTLDTNRHLQKINALPEVTIYTCAYNAEKYLNRCMGSVCALEEFGSYEYIIVDDGSTDSTYELATNFASRFSNVSVIRNEENLGLASSSNVALKNAKGRFIVRMDADDFFTSKNSIIYLLDKIRATQADVVYPANFYGDYDHIQFPQETHHIGGALFSTRAINSVKFTEGLRGFEGLDFFKRAKNVLHIAYLATPIFFYRQRPNSLSKTNLEERRKLREEIEQKPFFHET